MNHSLGRQVLKDNSVLIELLSNQSEILPSQAIDNSYLISSQSRLKNNPV